MDMRKTAEEIGLFETAVNLSKVSGSEEVICRVGDLMPLPDTDITERVTKIAKWLCDFGKEKYMFFAPEIALIDKMGKMADRKVEIIIVLPFNMESEAKERVKNNLPRGMKIHVLEEPNFIDDFYPGNGMFVISGYTGGGREMILMDTYRMVEHYSAFYGKKVFVPYAELKSALRYDGWMEIKQTRFSEEWRNVS